jgi:hypothetical protein
MNETHSSVETLRDEKVIDQPAKSNGGFTIKGKPGDRYVVGGNGWSAAHGAWTERKRVFEMGEDGQWKFIGYHDELQPKG